MNRIRQEPLILEEVTDPIELAKAHVQDERFERNWKWFEAHAAEIYRCHRGKVYCVAGQELFVADTPNEVIELARSAHPADDGLFTGYIPQKRTARIYANRRRLASVR